jgi:hypothetical protein
VEFALFPALSLGFMENLPMFDLIKWWQFRTTTNRPPRFRNRVALSFEDLEVRTLLSSGVVQATVLNGPLSAVAVVAEPVNLNATSAQSQQTLSEVVPGGSSSKVLPARLVNPGNSTGSVGPDAGSSPLVRAPIQTGSPSNGTMGSTGQPVVSTLAPAINTASDLVLPGVNAALGPTTSPSGVLPGPGTTGGTLVGGRILIPGGVTTPPTPARQILAGIVNTADPYAAFERTILTKEGFKTASGREVPTPPQDNDQQNPVRAEVPITPPNQNQQNLVRTFGAFEEEEELDLLDLSQAGSDDQAARQRHKTDAFFTDGALMGEDQGWAHGHSVALAGAMLMLGGLWLGGRGRHAGHR